MILLLINMADTERIETSVSGTVAVNYAGE